MKPDFLQSADRKPLRDIVYERILTALLDGAFAQGERLRDTDLAQQLGASRTPVREALLLLANHGHVEALPGRGFRVAQLTYEEAAEVYPLLALLELEALRTSLPCSDGQKATLSSCLQAMTKEDTGIAQVIRLDQHFHEILLAGSPNQRLQKMIWSLRDTVSRYETNYFSSSTSRGSSTAEHEAIVAAFVQGRRDEAIEALRGHWQRSTKGLLDLIAR